MVGVLVTLNGSLHLLFWSKGAVAMIPIHSERRFIKCQIKIPQIEICYIDIRYILGAVLYPVK